MIITPYSFDGHLINDGTNYIAWMETRTPPVAPVQLGLVQRAQNFPKLSTKRLNGNAISVMVQCLGTAHQQFQTLKQWFDPYAQGEYTFIVRDITDSNTQYFWECVVTDIPEIQGENVMQINLFTTYPILRGVNELLTQETVTATGQTIEVTPGGNYRTAPRIEVTPTTTKGGNNYSQRHFIQIVNKTAIAYPDFPLDVTGGGVNTSAMVSGSQLQADMDDLRLWVDGVEVDYWLNSATPGTNTLIFSNISIAPMLRLRLRYSIASSGAVTDISCTPGTSTLALLKKLPSSGIVVIDNERFTYTSIDLKGYALRGCTRAAKASSMAAHSANAYIYWVQHDIWLAHGNSSAVAQVMDSTKKPMFDLATSTNGQWVFSSFASNSENRAGEWKPSVSLSSGKQSAAYTGDQGDEADPAEAMGMSVRSWQKNGRWQGETAQIQWTMNHPAGITSVTSDGEKYRETASWPEIVALQRSQFGTVWTGVWSEATPTAVQDWETWSHASAAIATSEYVRFVVRGSVSAVANNVANFEVQNCTLAIDTTQLPEITVGTAQATYYLDLTLTNTNTSEWMSVRWPMSLNETLVIDCENKEITHSDGTNAFAPMELSSIRAGWLDLLPGVQNNLTYADTGTSQATVRVYHRNRQS